ncbi:MAG: diheme cytochrome c-553 [Holophagales bacterium]|nr:MAG: diheme cytochrome c-553 [Holophagales bacterium]
MSDRRLAARCAAALIVTAVAASFPASLAAAEPAAPGNAVERGTFLVTLGGCNDCHTPLRMGPKGPEPDATRLLSGHPAKLVLPPPPAPQGPWVWFGAASGTAFAGPWGVSYAANLTPDEATGLGSWTEAQFISAMRTGRHLGNGRPILPPMPWQGLAHMTDADLKAIFAYLRSVPAIQNAAPESVVAAAPK